jgi:hypothetical protein
MKEKYKPGEKVTVQHEGLLYAIPKKTMFIIERDNGDGTFDVRPMISLRVSESEIKPISNEFSERKGEGK